MRLTKIVSAILLAGVIALPLQAQAQDKAAGEQELFRLVVAVIDVDAIGRKAKAALDIRQQVETLRNEFQGEVRKEEEELRAANQELARQRSVLSTEAFDEERRKFEQRLVEVQRKVQQRMQDLEAARGKAMTTIQGHLNAVVADIAKQNNLTLVLRRDQTVLVANQLDITDMVLTALDKRLPTIAVDVPAAAAEGKK